MRNIDKIKSMSVDEMADYLCGKEDDCDYCTYRFRLDNFRNDACVKNKLSKQWLLQEEE